MYFASARAAYQAYLQEGRSFLHARSLRRINLEARALLKEKAFLLPEEFQPCATALIGHYDIWLTLWEAHAERTKPAPEDPFVFENHATYPREAEEALERLHQKLRGPIN
jgi:hypothetical protein